MKKTFKEGCGFLLHSVTSIILGVLFFNLICDKGIADFPTLADYNLYRFMGGAVWSFPAFLLIRLCLLAIEELRDNRQP